MISMRAMGVENNIEEELDKIQQLRDKLIELIPVDDNENYDWLNVRDEYGDQNWEEQIDKLRSLSLALLQAANDLDCYNYARSVLQS